MLTNLKKLRGNKKGFTLVEMIVAIAILAILAAVLVPTLIGVVGDAEGKAQQAQESAIISAAQYILLKAENDGKAIKHTDGWMDDTAEGGNVSKADIITYFGNTALTTGQFQIKFTIDSGKITGIEKVVYNKGGNAART